MERRLPAGSLDCKADAALADIQRTHPNLLPSKLALIGVSGGRDSVALLHFLASRGWEKLVVCHLNHQLRGEESDRDAAFVRKLAIKHGLKCEIEKRDAAAEAKRRKISIELAGRELRSDFFRRMAARHGSSFVFLAHHADDQAETVLGNLFRGCGLHGAMGMEWISDNSDRGIRMARPLLAVRRSEIDDYIRRHGLVFREDSSNQQPAHRRNRIRHEVMPLLDEVFGRDIVPIINRFAELARRDDECLQKICRELLSLHGWLQHDGSLRITPSFKLLGPSLQSRVFIRMFEQHGVSVAHATVENALAMLTPVGPAKINLPGRKHLRRIAGRMWIEG